MRNKRLYVVLVVLLLAFAIVSLQGALANGESVQGWPALPTDGPPRLVGKDGIALTPTPAPNAKIPHDQSTPPTPIQFRKRVNLSKGMNLAPNETLWHVSVQRIDGSVDSYVVPERLFTNRSDKNMRALFDLRDGDQVGFGQKISRQTVKEMFP